MVDQQTNLSAVDDTGLEHYRGICAWSPLALVLAFLSPLAFLHLLLGILPLATVLFSIVALRQIRGNPELLGRTVALVALALAVFVGTAATANRFFSTRFLYQQARPVAEAWLEVLRREELEKAHQWTLPLLRRQPQGSSLASYYENDSDAKEALKKFFDQPQLVRFMEALPEGQLHFRKNERQLQSRQGDFVTQQFVLVRDRADPSHDLPILVHIQRKRDANTGAVHWVVTGASDPDDVRNER